MSPRLRLAIVLLVGAVATLIVGGLRMQGASRERDALVSAQVDAIETGFVAEIEGQFAAFGSVVNFVSSTHPGSLTEYQAFVADEIDFASDLDPGVLFFEPVLIDGVDALREREADLGNEFDITLFPNEGDLRLILMRSGRNVDIFGVPLLGLDATSFAESITDTSDECDSFEASVVDEGDLFALFGGESGDRDHPYLVVMQRPVMNRVDGTIFGCAIRALSTDKALDVERLAKTTPLEFQVWPVGEGLVAPIRRGVTSPDLVEVERTFMAGELEWRLSVWDPTGDFGPDAGIAGQWVIGVIGILATLLVAAAMHMRARVRATIESQSFEIEHAWAVASTDSLTGLLNRAGFIEAARRFPSTTDAIVLFVDLDGFKAVNDDSGHEHGDEVLRATARALRSIVRQDDLVARFGGDEFVIFSQRPHTIEDVNVMSERVTSRVAEIDHRVSCSVGVARRAPGESADVKSLIRAADAAMYVAKNAGGGRHEIHADHAS